MESKIRTCALCGKQYKYCGHCEKDAATPWKNLFHSEACRDLFEIAAKYREKAISLDEARKMVKALDISDVDIAGIKGIFKPFVLEITKATTSSKPKEVVSEEKVELEPGKETETSSEDKIKKYFSKRD